MLLLSFLRNLSCEIGIPQVSATASSNSIAIAVNSIAVFYPRAPEQGFFIHYSPSTGEMGFMNINYARIRLNCLVQLRIFLHRSFGTKLWWTLGPFSRVCHSGKRVQLMLLKITLKLKNVMKELAHLARHRIICC